MADLLYELLTPHLPPPSTPFPSSTNTSIKSTTSSSSTATRRANENYLTRLTTLRLSDLSTTEPQSIHQATHSNTVSIQALSSRSHRSTTTSSDHLSVLTETLPSLSTSVNSIRSAIPALDDSAVKFASQYSKTRSEENAAIQARKEAMLLTRQADKLQDILDLPNLLATTIALAGTGSAGGANYTQALDLYAHIKRLQILYPDSKLIKSILIDAEVAMKDMTTQLITSLRGQNIRLAAAIRTIGLLRRVVPELGLHSSSIPTTGQTLPGAHQIGFSSLASPLTPTTPSSQHIHHQEEGDFGALFLCARLGTFLNMTEALSPLKDLADQETAKRLSTPNHTSTTDIKPSLYTTSRPGPQSRSNSSQNTTSNNLGYTIQGQQTERYLKRYIEIFREQSFATVSMYKSIFSDTNNNSPFLPDKSETNTPDDIGSLLALPSSLQSFPLYLIEMFVETIKTYLPNIVDPATRESLLMQILYAANSLGRLGADFSLMIAFLDDDDELDEETPEVDHVAGGAQKVEVQDIQDGEQPHVKASPEVDGKVDTGMSSGIENDREDAEPLQKEPEWIRVIKKHRVQAARLEALAAGQDQRSSSRKGSSDVPR